MSFACKIGILKKKEVVNMEINWEELSISNDFIFGKVMQNAKLCKELLEIILGIKIDRVEYPEPQKSIDVGVDAKSVRLDVYVQDGKNSVYDIEMQTTDGPELPKRSRYYQGAIDVGMTDKGTFYKDLKRSYIIFICTFDPFGRDRCVYTFTERCQEEPDLELGDDTYKIFLNATGQTDGMSEELTDFLEYVAGKEPKTSAVKRLDEEVQQAKRNKEWRREFMTLLMRDEENVRKGMEKGIVVGEKRGMETGIRAMVEMCQEDGRSLDSTSVRIKEKFSMSPEDAIRYVKKFWK